MLNLICLNLRKLENYSNHQLDQETLAQYIGTLQLILKITQTFVIRLGLAFRSSSILAMLTWPSLTAICSGVQRSLVALFGDAPFLRSRSMASAFPCLAAMCNAVCSSFEHVKMVVKSAKCRYNTFKNYFDIQNLIQLCKSQFYYIRRYNYYREELILVFCLSIQYRSLLILTSNCTVGDLCFQHYMNIAIFDFDTNKLIRLTDTIQYKSLYLNKP